MGEKINAWKLTTKFCLPFYKERSLQKLFENKWTWVIGQKPHSKPSLPGLAGPQKA